MKVTSIAFGSLFSVTSTVGITSVVMAAASGLVPNTMLIFSGNEAEPASASIVMRYTWLAFRLILGNTR